MRTAVLGTLLFSFIACTPTNSNSSSEQVLHSQYGRKKIYLWNSSVTNSKDKITRSCWYYKEVPPSAAKSITEELKESVRLNQFAIHDDHVQNQLEKILKEKLINAGADFVPCGLASISVAAAVASGGASALAFGLSSAWMANNCIKNSFVIQKNLREWRASGEGLLSLKNGETETGQIYSASKVETDMFREAIKRAKQLGMEDKDKCQPANTIKPI